ncbi:MAG: hypothetical protein ACD_76C00143G0004 [uncultured bacterium]|nr:MAG: hypothetical protein ACD_76C00143G0004 [uncultured bacterium]HBD05014.1 hypothetical protein [Candidatus Uhrbacteria bacterium]
MDEFAWHAIEKAEIFKRFNTSANGLSFESAKKLILEHGRNELPKEKRAPWFFVFARQLRGPLIAVLLFASAISAALKEFADAVIILIAVLLNTVLGFFQEFKADKALEKLRSYIVENALVRRDGSEQLIPASVVVPGDILLLRLGDRVAADARVIFCSGMQTNEMPLTGESMPVEKTDKVLPAGQLLAERANMVYAGTAIVAGTGEAVVVATGAKTQFGQIATLVKQVKDERTPLQKQLDKLAVFISVVVVCVAVILFVIGIALGRSVYEMFLLVTALSVAAVPEGLLIAITFILAIGAQRILKRKAVIRRLVAAETLGSVSVICTDKTGTITEGKMKTEYFSNSEESFWVKDAPKEISSATRFMLEAALLCNDAFVKEAQEDHGIEFVGSPTETALLESGYEFGVSLPDLHRRHARIFEIPFDSARKYMVTLHEWDSERIMIIKGAPEIVFGKCDSVFSNSAAQPLTEETRKKLISESGDLADKGLRVMAVACRFVSKSVNSIVLDDLSGFASIGIFGIRDPLRAEARETIALAESAGIRTVLVTGDHPKTALAISTEAGIRAGLAGLITGPELDSMTDDELRNKIQDISVFARVEPRHKIRIVEAWQNHGQVVAMTGDGVNDAPALKKADIGIALGSGTDVAKEASDIVLLDNNLKTILAAAEGGRTMFDNMRKVIAYLLIDSFSEIVLIAGSILMRLPLPLLPIHILWINIVTDGFPGLALTLEPSEPNIMGMPPRKKGEALLDGQLKILIFLIGIITDLALFGLFLYLLSSNGDEAHARTVVFMGLAIDSLIYAFALKSLRRSIFRMNPFSNPWLVAGVAAGFGLQLLTVTVPFMRDLFKLAPLVPFDFVLLVLMALIKFSAIEITKEFFLYSKKTV